MYASVNFKTKKELKLAVAAGQKVSIYQPNNIFGVETPSDGVVSIEGPWYPKPHAWYAVVTLKNDLICKVK